MKFDADDDEGWWKSRLEQEANVLQHWESSDVLQAFSTMHRLIHVLFVTTTELLLLPKLLNCSDWNLTAVCFDHALKGLMDRRSASSSYTDLCCLLWPCRLKKYVIVVKYIYLFSMLNMFILYNDMLIIITYTLCS